MAWQPPLLARLMAPTTRTGGESEGTSECTFLTPPPLFFFFSPLNKIHLITLDFLYTHLPTDSFSLIFIASFVTVKTLLVAQQCPYLHCPTLVPYMASRTP